MNFSPLAYIVTLTQMVLLISTLLLSRLYCNPARVIFILLLRILQLPPYVLPMYVDQVWTLLTCHKQDSLRPVLFQPISYPTSPSSPGCNHTEHFNSTFSLSIKSLAHDRHLLNICLSWIIIIQNSLKATVMPLWHKKKKEVVSRCMPEE